MQSLGQLHHSLLCTSCTYQCCDTFHHDTSPIGLNYHSPTDFVTPRIALRRHSTSSESLEQIAPFVTVYQRHVPTLRCFDTFHFDTSPIGLNYHSPNDILTRRIALRSYSTSYESLGQLHHSLLCTSCTYQCCDTFHHELRQLA